MTLEYLNEQKAKYQTRVEYYKNFSFERISNDFQNVVDLIGEMEDYIKEKENGKVYCNDSEKIVNKL